MKQYPKHGLLACGLAVLTLVNLAEAQSPSSKSPPTDRTNSSIVISCFSQVHERVLAGNTRLKSQTAKLNALRSQTRQAALLPNPVFSFDAENLGGDRLDDQVQYTSSVSQRIETGGKRRARVALTKANAGAFELRKDILAAELLAKSLIAYAEAISAKARLRQSQEFVDIRQTALRLISRNSSYGGTLKLEVAKAQVSLEDAKIIRDRRDQELQAAKRALSSLWGDSESDLKIEVDELELHHPERDVEPAKARTLPDVAYADAERKAATVAAEAQRALAVPDVTVSAGFRRFDATGGQAFVAGISVPLTLFDRNQYALEGAEEQLKATRFDVTNVRTTVRAELGSLRDSLRLLLRERKLLRERVLPQTESVLATATDAYRLGRINYLDYFDAQTTYLDHRERLVTVTLAAFRNQVEIQRLNGTIVDRTTQMNQGECNAR